MKRNIFNHQKKILYSFLTFDNKAALEIQNHFRLSNYQMFILIWVKGLWTGILLSLIIHYFISH